MKILRLCITLLITSVLFQYCSPEPPSNETIYLIKKNAHYSIPRKFETVKNQKIQFFAKFDEACVYDLGNNNQADLNKLYGFVDCNSSVHQNSARFAWRWYENKLEIWTYVYANSEVVYHKIGETPFNTYLKYSISINNVTGKYDFVFNDTTTIEETRGLNLCTNGTYWKDYPYFGGNEVAPHDMRIGIKEIQ